MSLNGFIVLNNEGLPLYSKMLGLDIKLDTKLLGMFYKAIQNFAKEIDGKEDSYIRKVAQQSKEKGPLDAMT